MDYTQLDIEHKRAFLMNLRSAALCTDTLAKITGVSIEELSEELLEESSKTIEQLSDTEVDKYVVEVEFHHRTQGGTLRLKKYST